jgi:hypothetical protein
LGIRCLQTLHAPSVPRLIRASASSIARKRWLSAMHADLQFRFGIGIRLVNEIAFKSSGSRNARLRIGLGKQQLPLLLQQSFPVSPHIGWTHGRSLVRGSVPVRSAFYT